MALAQRFGDFMEHLLEIVPTVSLRSCKGIVVFGPDFDFFFTRL